MSLFAPILAFFCTFGILLQFLWFLAFLAFCLGEIFGSQGAEASTGLYYGALEWEIALKLPIVIVPLLPIAPSLLHVSTESKNAVSSPLSENTPSYRVSWRREGSNYESNQP